MVGVQFVAARYLRFSACNRNGRTAIEQRYWWSRPPTRRCIPATHCRPRAKIPVVLATWHQGARRALRVAEIGRGLDIEEDTARTNDLGVVGRVGAIVEETSRPRLGECFDVRRSDG